MSLAPSNNLPEDTPIPRAARVAYTAKKIVVGYFEKPFHYLFYVTILGVVCSLLLGRRPPFELYVFLMGFAGAEFFDSSLIFRTKKLWKIRSSRRKSRT